ncbi:hypothetical protein RHGRI_033305 [Rhododendron griersonianum]|uniref:Uncharacterized protein n=1 Tax=Rhododendron griersonianum TaxID=479676 RepID=A0AAV6HX37_9ERIC|nr:hypothetical protein RHGRI_033305 [Rhododendron griersonianum]
MLGIRALEHTYLDGVNGQSRRPWPGLAASIALRRGARLSQKSSAIPSGGILIRDVDDKWDALHHKVGRPLCFAAEDPVTVVRDIDG